MYTLGIALLRLAYWCAQPFSAKARLFASGRKHVWSQLNTLPGSVRMRVWMHCASVGEFEQGRPVLERIRHEFPEAKIVLSFFSPSGYELRKNYAHADAVTYLPWDTRYNAKKWLDVVRPSLVIFVKYEFWLHYTRQMAQRQVPLISISSIFRESQPFFQWYGPVFRNMLTNFRHFFVQNAASASLLKSVGITQVTVSGDTRFDRVLEVASRADEIALARQFKADEKVMVVGSCWPDDIAVLAPFINERHLKFIIAPHEISATFLAQIEKSLQVKTVRYSAARMEDVDQFDVLLIDNIGLLSRLYRYGEFAFVGGAFGKGLHNILEAACYGVPVFFGNKNYQKFVEAHELVMRGGAFEIADFSDLKSKYEMLNLPENFLLACEVTKSYVAENRGATEKIMTYCRKLLSQ
jgi:3-deoxy-D-manno-octulosonic-acid transferase